MTPVFIVTFDEALKMLEKKAIKFFRGYGTKGLWKNGKTKYSPNSYQRKHKKSRDL
jgi:hypothetical protein